MTDQREINRYLDMLRTGSVRPSRMLVLGQPRHLPRPRQPRSEVSMSEKKGNQSGYPVKDGVSKETTSQRPATPPKAPPPAPKKSS